MQLYAESLCRLDRDLLRHAMAMSFTAPAAVASEMLRLDELLIERTEALISRLQARGLIATDVAAGTAALALYACFTTAMLLWMVKPRAGARMLQRALDQQLAVVFRGLAPGKAKRRRR